MTLHDFITITRHIAQIEMKISINRPDAVCVSRHLYNMLKLQVEMQKYIVPQNAEEYLDRVNGLVVFVDDDMPDDYYQVGYKKMFIDHFIAKEKIKRISEK